MRIAVGQLWQETNTFNRNLTTLADFENWGIATGNDVLEKFGETGELAGFVAGTREWDHPPELVGLARFLCWPYGRVGGEAWRSIQQTFVESLDRAGDIDGILVSLHGAMSAEGEDDVTGSLLELMRRKIGPATPLVATLDLHANVTRRMITNADLLVGYHTQPHLDQFETGARAARGLSSILERHQRPVKHWRKLPMITAAETHNTTTGPAAHLFRQLVELERDPNVLAASLFMVMPWHDCPELGWTVAMYTSTDDDRWNSTVSQIATTCWDLRDAMNIVERYDSRAVVAKALSHGGHPIAIGDGADATNSGAPGDSTALLREFLKQQSIPHGALTFVVDPTAVLHAENVGVGGMFDASVGAIFSPEFCEPIRFCGTVERLLPMQFELNGALGHKIPVHMGRSAVVRSGDVTVVFIEKSGPGSTPLLYETAGLNPRKCGIVVAKSPTAFRADYDPFVAGTYIADSPGCATPDWSRLKFHNFTPPLWPLQNIASPDEAEWSRN